MNIDVNVEKNIIEFFNEEIINTNTNELKDKNNFQTDLKYGLSKSNRGLFKDDEIRFKEKVPTMNYDKRLIKSVREHVKRLDEEKNVYEKHLVKTEPSTNLNLRSSEEKVFLNNKENRDYLITQNNVFCLGLDSTNESNF